MNFNYLYYPSISLPNNAWLRKVLLYSENISSIVPYDLEDSLRSDYNINLLKSENEYASLSPEEFLFSNGNEESVENFNKEVNEYFGTVYFQKLLSQNKNRNKTLVYDSKFTHEIGNSLREMDVLQENTDRWWETPAIVGDTYLGILAKHMGSKYNYVPTTSTVKYQNMAFKNTSLPREKVGELRLIDALPSPSSDVSIKDLLKLKKERKQELLKFRTVLRQNMEKLSLSINEEQLFENIQIFKEEIEIEVTDLGKLLNENRINFVFESIKTLVAMDKELISKIFTGATISATTGTSLLSGATIGAVTDIAVNISSVIKDYHIQKNSIIRDSPYSYAFYTNQLNSKNLSRRLINKVFN